MSDVQITQTNFPPIYVYSPSGWYHTSKQNAKKFNFFNALKGRDLKKQTIQSNHIYLKLGAQGSQKL